MNKKYFVCVTLFGEVNVVTDVSPFLCYAGSVECNSMSDGCIGVFVHSFDNPSDFLNDFAVVCCDKIDPSASSYDLYFGSYMSPYDLSSPEGFFRADALRMASVLRKRMALVREARSPL